MGAVDPTASRQDQHIEPDATRAGQDHSQPHPRRGVTSAARARCERLQHGRAGEGSGRRARNRLRALPFEARAPRRARVDDVAHARARRRSRRSDGDPLTALRDMLGAVCRHWSAHDETIRDLRTLVAATGATPSLGGINDAYLRRLVEATRGGRPATRPVVDRRRGRRARGAHVVRHVRAAARSGAGARTPAQVETLFARLAVVIVSPTATGASTAPTPATAVTAG